MNGTKKVTCNSSGMRTTMFNDVKLLQQISKLLLQLIHIQYTTEINMKLNWYGHQKTLLVTSHIFNLYILISHSIKVAFAKVLTFRLLWVEVQMDPPNASHFNIFNLSDGGLISLYYYISFTYVLNLHLRYNNVQSYICIATDTAAH